LENKRLKRARHLAKPVECFKQFERNELLEMCDRCLCWTAKTHDTHGYQHYNRRRNNRIISSNRPTLTKLNPLLTTVAIWLQL